MNTTTLVLLITGFLGSGKTTFLNRIIDRFPADLKLTILMNEFGEIGVDGTLVEGEDIDMMEISRGSIFCVCVKTDFIKGLYELNATVKPDLLIIESTGVANPSDLKRDLKLPIFNDRFEFCEQFCIIDAVHFLEAFEIFACVEKQLSTSTVFVINKTDLVSSDVIEKIKITVRKNHTNPRFFETTYADISFDSFQILAGKNIKKLSDTAGSVSEILSVEELDDFINGVLASQDLEISPPDRLASVTYTWHGNSPEEFQKMAKNLPSAIVRAKGFVLINDKIHLFSYVMGDWTFELSTKKKKDINHINKVVYIGDIERIDSLKKTMADQNWSAGEVLQPFGNITKM